MSRSQPPNPRAVRCLLSFLAFGAVSSSVGCYPYVAGNTAQTLYPGDRVGTLSVFAVPDAVVRTDSATVLVPLADVEWRWGLNESADFGLRLTSFSGLNVNYKKRIAGYNHPDSAATAYMLGLGTPDFFLHASTDVTLITSLKKRGAFTPYGGLRAMYAVPVRSDIVRKTPAAGAFLGVRIGNWARAVIPEIGVYYDEPREDLRKWGNVIVVPSISIHGFEWLLPIRR